MTRFFARCLRGLEDLVWEEISQIPGCTFIRSEIRTIFFSYEGNLEPLSRLKSVDDLFILCAEWEQLDHTRASLAKIQAATPSLKSPIKLAVEQLRTYREIPAHASFSITPGLQGKKNYSRFEISEALRPGLEKLLGSQYIENAPQALVADLNIRILMEGPVSYIGIRLSKSPMHRRDYKQANLPGSTKPPLAFLMASLSGIKASDRVLDPCCGVGTLLIEAAQNFQALSFQGFDKKEEAVEAALANSEHAGLEIPVKLSDFTQSDLADASIEKIISNLPWGKQVATTEDIPVLYEQLFSVFTRILTPGAKLVLLSDQKDWMEKLLLTRQEFKLLASYPMSLFGSLPCLYVLSFEGK